MHYRVFLFKCVILSEFILMDEVPTSQWYKWGWSSPISISCMIPAHVFSLGTSSGSQWCPQISRFLPLRRASLQIRKWELYTWYFLHVHKREPQDMSLNERAVSGLLCQKWLEPSNSFCVSDLFQCFASVVSERQFLLYLF